jgi:hypothetical protein
MPGMETHQSALAKPMGSLLWKMETRFGGKVGLDRGALPQLNYD